MKKWIWIFSVVWFLLAIASAFAASNSDISDACCAGGCLTWMTIVLTVNVLILVFVITDAGKRGTSAGAWIAVVLLFGIPGLLAYLIFRPQGKLIQCPNCGQQKTIIALICPHCGKKTE